MGRGGGAVKTVYPSRSALNDDLSDSLTSNVKVSYSKHILAGCVGGAELHVW